MGVAAEDVHQAGCGKRLHSGGHLLTQEEVRRRLDQRAGFDQLRDAIEHVGGEVALGVGDQRPVAAFGELLDPAGEAIAKRSGRRLQQDPDSSAQPHLQEFGLAESLDRALSHLPTLNDTDGDTLLAQPLVQRPPPGRRARRCERRGRGGCGAWRR